VLGPTGQDLSPRNPWGAVDAGCGPWWPGAGGVDPRARAGRRSSLRLGKAARSLENSRSAIGSVL